MALDKYKNKIPWLIDAENERKAKLSQADAKFAAELDKTASETLENVAQANKANTEATKTASWWGGGTWTAKTVDLQSKDIEYDIPNTITIAGKTVNLWNKVVNAKWSYNKKTWEYSVDWKVITWARPSSKQSALDALFGQ